MLVHRNSPPVYSKSSKPLIEKTEVERQRKNGMPVKTLAFAAKIKLIPLRNVSSEKEFVGRGTAFLCFKIYFIQNIIGHASRKLVVKSVQFDSTESPERPPLSLKRPLKRLKGGRPNLIHHVGQCFG